jgi:hypothetical protein
MCYFVWIYLDKSYRYQWLAWQDTLCCVWFFSSLLVIYAAAHLYLSNTLQWWAVICVNGITISIMHELEHDILLPFASLPPFSLVTLALIHIKKISKYSFFGIWNFEKKILELT